ncbi:MAG TPA: hypothetical protein VG986_19860 [Pseudolabrys sp.]|nr:hypothetical protein [Pseudolabrys sp.]
MLLAGLPLASAQAQQPPFDGFANGGQAPLHFPYVSMGPHAIVAAPNRQLRRRHAAKHSLAHTRRRLSDKPLAIETVRAGDAGALAAARDGGKGRGNGKGRVIHAEAEVTIFGPDRMIIRLHRKNSRGGERNVRTD